MNRAKKIVLWLILVTLVFAVYYIVSNIIGSFIYFTSFPWWSAFVFATIYFGPLLVLECVVYGVLSYIQRKKNKV